MTRLLIARLAATAAALVLLFGLATPAALARPAVAAPAAPHLPAVDWWGIGKCASWLIPNAPKTPDGPLACAKSAVKGGQATGKVMSESAKKVAASVLGDAAKSMAEFVSDVIREGFTWWLTTPSVQVEDSGVLGDPASKDPAKQLSLHTLMAAVGAGIATLLVIFQGIKTIIQRKGAPLAHLLQGLMINMLVSAAGIAIIDSLLVASDELTIQILYVGFGGDDVPERMALMLLPVLVNPIGLFVIALIVMIVGGIQMVMLFLRQAAIPIQALILPIAGAGQLGGENTRQWLPRTFTAIMVIIIYKPVAALIISVGFTEMAHGNGIIDFIRGIVTLALSIVALKSLFALFTPIGAAIGGAVSSGGGLGGALGMAGNALASHMGGSGSGGGDSSTSAVRHAADMERNGPAGGGGKGSGGDADGSSAIQHSTPKVPPQGGGSTEAATEAASTATQGATNGAAATGTAAASAAPPVAIAMVAAEAGQAAIKKAGGTVGGSE